MNKLVIEAIKTDICYFVRAKRTSYTYYNGAADVSGLELYFFDGKKLERTHNEMWLKISNIPQRIEQEICQPNINHRYELIDKTLESEKFPLVLEKDKVTIKDGEGFIVWKKMSILN